MSVYDIFPVKEVSGNIVTFEDGADGIPMESLSAVIEPIQDLHGYANPWPAGGGANKCSYDTDYTPTAGVNNNTINLFSLTLAAGTYTFSCKQSVNVATSTRNTLVVNVGSNAAQYENSGTNYNPANLRHTITFTVSEESTVVFSIWCHTPSTAATYNEWQVESGSFTAYSPYSNICPISGRTGLSVYRTGKNLVDPAKKVATSTTTAKWYNDGTGFLLHGGQAYALSSNISTDATYFVYIYDMGGTQLAYGKWTATYTPAVDVYVYFQYYESGGAHLADAELQLELGSSATTYEPYNGNTYSVDWTTQAGTVYGGTVDVVTGLLTVDRAMYTFTGNEDFGIVSASQGFNYFRWYGSSFTNVVSGWNTSNNAIMSNYKVKNQLAYWYSGGVGEDNVAWTVKDYGGLCVRADQYADRTSFKASLAGQTLCYLLATPVTYQLTPQEIATLLGLNNIWATVAPITVKYHAQAQTENARIDSLFVDGVDMQADGWFLKWRSLSAPKPKTDYVSVWGRDGDIDLTENESDGQVFYENRNLMMDMVYIGEDWIEAYSELLDMLHGKECMVQFSNDPYWYWAGRIIASLYEHKPHSLAMSGIMFPYKLSVAKVIESATVTGLTESNAVDVVLPGSRMRVSPKVTVTAGSGDSVTLKWGGNTQALSAGTYYVRGLKVGSDDVTIKVYGTGTVNFEYRKGML